MEKRKLINNLLDSVEGGRDIAAAYLGMSTTQFNNRLYESKGQKFFTVDDLLALQQLSKTTLVADFFANHANAFVVKIPELSELDNVELHHLNLKADAKKGKVDQLIVKAISNDGVIDTTERDEIISSHLRAIAARYAAIKATLELYGER